MSETVTDAGAAGGEQQSALPRADYLLSLSSLRSAEPCDYADADPFQRPLYFPPSALSPRLIFLLLLNASVHYSCVDSLEPFYDLLLDLPMLLVEEEPVVEHPNYRFRRNSPRDKDLVESASPLSILFLIFALFATDVSYACLFVPSLL